VPGGPGVRKWSRVGTAAPGPRSQLVGGKPSGSCAQRWLRDQRPGVRAISASDGHSGGDRPCRAPAAEAAGRPEDREARPGSKMRVRATRGDRRLLPSAALDYNLGDRWRGAPLHTPEPAPPSAGFSLKAPGSVGRSRFPARPLCCPPPSLGRTSPGGSSCGGAAGAPEMSEQGGSWRCWRVLPSARQRGD
jgi:hypothetical protein